MNASLTCRGAAGELVAMGSSPGESGSPAATGVTGAAQGESEGFHSGGRSPRQTLLTLPLEGVLSSARHPASHPCCPHMAFSLCACIPSATSLPMRTLVIWIRTYSDDFTEPNYLFKGPV